ncbi:efflux RND transporter periplasmic adaptor subunit [Alkalilacustris brevis]|uniref:efflux RND transporter periplasmic adaptor subunit n=1 Tax=Alkalilacustris brevis TaxID=2026338 RepID=UPI000E0D8FC7|nr:efflux RND transporter periplasmic adaptor subunit [Alkalilacustris brevis]
MKYFFSAVSGSTLAVALAFTTPTFAQSAPGGVLDLGAANCRLVPKRDSSLSVSAREIIETVHHRLGDRVSEGDVLLELGQGSLVAQMRQAEVTLEMARQRLERADQMQGVLSVAELSEIESELLIAQIQRDGLIAEQRRYVLRAPHDGVVVELFADVGEVAPDGPLIRLVQVDTLQAELDVPGQFHQPLSVSETLVIALADGNEVEAEISFVDVLIEPVSQTFRLHALIDNEDGAIIAGTSCRAFMPDG